MSQPDELLAKAERADHIVHIAELLLGLLIIGVLGFLTVATIRTNQQLEKQIVTYQEQTRRQAEDSRAIISQMKQQSDTQTAYIRCIAQFFARSDRASRTIADIDSCQIGSVSASGAISALPSPVAAQNPAKTSAPTTTPQNTPQPTPAPITRPAAPASLTQSIANTIGGIFRELTGI